MGKVFSNRTFVCIILSNRRYMEERNMSNDKELMIINETKLKDKIYTIRGQKDMLDFDLAEIYGFSVSAFNQQVKRNISRFDEDFMFRLNEMS